MSKAKVVKELKNFETFLKALKEVYPSDPTSPGLVISILSDGQYYLSIRRYTEKFGGGQYVVMARKSPDLVEAYDLLLDSWLDLAAPRPISKNSLDILLKSNRS
jgi:hypothetical protein